MNKFPVRVAATVADRRQSFKSPQSGPGERRRKIQFKDDRRPRLSQSKANPPMHPTIVDRSNFLRDWPHPPTIPMTTNCTDHFVDPFPLFEPSIARYFSEDDRPLLHRHVRHPDKEHAHGDGPNDTGDEPHSVSCRKIHGEDLSFNAALIDKRYAYSQKGTIKDFFDVFQPLLADDGDAQDDVELPEEVNRQILHAMADDAAGNSGGKFTEITTPAGETDGWDEDEHTPVYWNQRIREVDFFVKHDVWSVDPIGDWSHLNRNRVPKDFLRKLRRYLEVRPLEYLNDTGSYRMFHVLNQYNDLRRILDNTNSLATKALDGVKNWTIGCCGKKSVLDEAREMELDYLVMIWLSIWDPQLKANIFQLKEISMSDWFFSRVGWGTAVGVNELLTKNELHAFDNYWEHRPERALQDDEEEGEFEDLEDWITGEDDDGESQQSGTIQSETMV